MIGIVGAKRNSGKSSFADLIGYMNDKKPERVAFKGYVNIIFPENAVEEMEAVAVQNKRCKDPTMHLILSWREMESPHEEQVKEAVEIALKEMGVEECQAAWSLHNDTQNHHLHIAVNRVHPEKYNAIDPAGGWTRNAIHRAARKIELAQNWEIEQNGVYYVTSEGELKQKAEDPTKEKYSKTALDIEAHTAQKSAERIAKETAAPKIRAAGTWEELHKNLAAEGIEFVKKGSGAVLKIDDSFVKISIAGRDLSMTKLIAKLGNYEPRPQSISDAERKPEAVERVNERDVKTEWMRYISERDKYHKEKMTAQKEVGIRHKEEYKFIRKAHRQRRKDLFKESWAGRGSELNTERSLLAASQAKDILNLRERQKRERDQLADEYGRQFKSFKKWLEEQKNPKSSLLFRYMENGAIYIEDGVNDINKDNLLDIRSFSARSVCFGRMGGVVYAKEREQEAAFIDYGRKIVVNDQFSGDSILAALQLANQKWGNKICIRGTDEYIKACVKIAKEYNLRIDNYDVNATEERTEAKDTVHESQARAQQGSGSGDHNGAYWAHAKDILANMARVDKTGAEDYSRLDAMIGIRMRVTGHTRAQVCDAIETNAPVLRQEKLSPEEFQEKYSNHDWRSYAEETTKRFVYGTRGYKQFVDADSDAPYLYKIEGRDFKAEKAEQEKAQGQMRSKGAEIDD